LINSILSLKNIPSRPSSTASNRPPSARPASALPTFYAIKCINRKSLTKTTEDLLINEIKILKHIKHENIVEMYDFQVNKIVKSFFFRYFICLFLKWDENYIYIVMEYCAGGDMSMFIRSRQQLSEARARPFVQQIGKNM
jgi:serine/threonine-protein kinase ULK/ATG1